MSWWSEALKHWANALHVDYHVERVREAESVQVGEWQQVDGVWIFVLDEHTVIHFPEFEGTPELRDALGWTLVKSRSTMTENKSKSEMDRVYDELVTNDTQALSQGLTQTRPSYITGSSQWSYPGYLILVRRAGSNPRSDETNAAWQQVIPDVLRATLGDVWYRYIGTEKDVLLYATVPELEDSFLDLPNPDAPHDHLNRLRQLGSLLATAIAQDAFLDARVLVSKRVESASGIHGALVSAVIAGRVEQSSKTNCAVFGAAPLPLFLRLSPENARLVFWQALMEKSTAPMADWPGDWFEIVQAVVAANLNISEAARLLYVHRNTLLNKIERLYQLTGHDVRQVGDATVLYLAAILTGQQPALKTE